MSERKAKWPKAPNCCKIPMIKCAMQNGVARFKCWAWKCRKVKEVRVKP